jgi:hypothetical protein
VSRTIARVLTIALVLAAPLAASAECKAPALRTFTEEERRQFEIQHGVNWWRAMGLIPGPETAADYVNRPAGDSIITVYIPQQFWDFRACAGRPGPPAPVTGPPPAPAPRQH